MEVLVTNPSIAHCHDEAFMASTSVTTSVKNKKGVYLGFHFCSEYFARNFVGMLQERGKHRMSNAVTTSLGSKPFLYHIKKLTPLN